MVVVVVGKVAGSNSEWATCKETVHIMQENLHHATNKQIHSFWNAYYYYKSENIIITAREPSKEKNKNVRLKTRRAVLWEELVGMSLFLSFIGPSWCLSLLGLLIIILKKATNIYHFRREKDLACLPSCLFALLFTQQKEKRSMNLNKLWW